MPEEQQGRNEVEERKYIRDLNIEKSKKEVEFFLIKEIRREINSLLHCRATNCLFEIKDKKRKINEYYDNRDTE